MNPRHSGCPDRTARPAKPDHGPQQSVSSIPPSRAPCQAQCHHHSHAKVCRADHGFPFPGAANKARGNLSPIHPRALSGRAAHHPRAPYQAHGEALTTLPALYPHVSVQSRQQSDVHADCRWWWTRAQGPAGRKPHRHDTLAAGLDRNTWGKSPAVLARVPPWAGTGARGMSRSTKCAGGEDFPARRASAWEGKPWSGRGNLGLRVVTLLLGWCSVRKALLAPCGPCSGLGWALRSVGATMDAAGVISMIRSTFCARIADIRSRSGKRGCSAAVNQPAMRASPRASHFAGRCSAIPEVVRLPAGRGS